MVDEGRTGETYNSGPWEDRGGVAAGTILATALAAGVIAYLIRRAREEEQQQQPVNRVTRLARDLTSSDTMGVGRDFLTDKILPEFKPALLAILAEIEDVLEQAFRRAEKAIKHL
jgi:hypothetical protein